MIDCEQATEYLRLKLHGDSTPSQEEQLQEHLDNCPSCKAKAGVIVETKERLSNQASKMFQRDLLRKEANNPPAN